MRIKDYCSILLFRLRFAETWNCLVSESAGIFGIRSVIFQSKTDPFSSTSNIPLPVFQSCQYFLVSKATLFAPSYIYRISLNRKAAIVEITSILAQRADS